MRHNVAHWWTWDIPLSTGVILMAFGLAPLLAWALVNERWVILVGLVAIALVPVVVRWPVVTTFGLYALLACSFDLAFFEGSTLTKPIGVVAGAALVAAGLVERRLGRPPSAALWWGLFMVWAALSIAWAINPDAAFRRLPSMLSLFFLYFVAVSFRPSPRELHFLCVLVVLGGVMAAGAAYLFGLDADAVGNQARARLSVGDETTNPNTLGRLLILPLALAIGGLVGSRGLLQRAIAVGCTGMIAVGIFISMSRSALVAVIAMLSVLLYRMRARWQIIAAIVILLALSAMMPDQFYARVVGVGGAADHSAAARIRIFQAGLESLERFGLFGSGLSTFTEVYKVYAHSAEGIGPHSMYLAVWVELGTIGLVLMLAALGSHLFVVQRARKAGHSGIVQAALEAACFGFLAGGVFAHIIWTKSFWLAWTLLTWAITCKRESDQA